VDARRLGVHVHVGLEAAGVQLRPFVEESG
jgi:hypothetical protein